MKRKPSRSALIKRADAAFSRYIRSAGICQARGLDGIACGGQLQCCHIESRVNKRLRWDEMNALCLCAGHHRFYTTRPFAWLMFIAENFPEKSDYVRAHVNEMWDRDLDAVLQRWEAWVA